MSKFYSTSDRSARRGSAAIEFVLFVPVLMILLAGIVDYGWYMSRYHLVQRATMDGARYGVRQATQEDPSGAQGALQVPVAEARTRDMLDDFGLTGGTVDATLLPDGNDGCPFDRLEVETNIPFTPIIGFVPTPNNITANFSMMSELQRD